MADKIEIKNFGVLKDIDIKINNINIIIGNQAQGKSLISRVIYFFTNLKSYLIEILFSSLQKEIQEKEEKELFLYIDRKLLDKFKNLFPSYLLDKNTDFSVNYYYNKYKKPFSIYTKNKELKIKLPQNVKNVIKKILSELNQSVENITKDKNLKDNTISKFEIIIEIIVRNIEVLNLTNKALLVPAGRAFFSYLEGNIFFLADNLNLNPILKDFGSNLQRNKNLYKEIIQKNNANISNEIKTLGKEILKGIYSRENEIDYLTNEDNLKIKLEDASSGQQELLPVVLTLIIDSISKNKYLYIIEEPEAHLYPSTQKKITNLLSYTYNKSNKDINLLITTHSPYILTSLNNLIQANNTYKLKPEKENEISKVISKNTWINFEEISAYYLNDGFCEDILDYETNLIDTKFIDAISNEISKEFYELLDIGYDD